MVQISVMRPPDVATCVMEPCSLPELRHAPPRDTLAFAGSSAGERTDHVAEEAAIPLRAGRLADIAARVPVPTYDRTSVRTGVVHLGVGGFHRAHQAMYLDRLLAAGGSSDWGICGVGVLPADAAMRDVLRRQDGLYTLVLKSADGTREPRVVGSLVDYLFAPDDPDAVVERLAHPSTRIVSLTVTEGGYNFDQRTGEFDASQPDVVHDLAPGAAPRTIFGLVTAGLARRRERGIVPFTVMSCDNIQHNGQVARSVFTAFARLRDPELAAWMEEQVRFPDCMVDRITPATTGADRVEVRSQDGIDDGWPVVCEPFTQWVLEDHFSAGRPDLAAVGVQLVEDVAPYELMKLRLLNAGHQALAYFGYLMGYRLVHDAARDPQLAHVLLGYMDREATPTLRPVPGIDLTAYKLELVERFSNPAIRDTLARLAFDASERIPKFIVPAVLENLAADRDVTLGAAIIASWARYATGTDEDGAPIAVDDRLKDTLGPLARRGRVDPLAFLRVPELFGGLADDERFTGPYRRTLDSLYRRGARATLADLVGGAG
jgi:mannitol 2-dehydrogenase